MKGKLLCLLGGLGLSALAWGREFTVMVYNVENLFDLDGVALYEDYAQGAGKSYGIEALLNKLEGIRQVVSSQNDGAGPEVIMFQEFELDRTPYDTPSAERFLAETKGTTLEALLREDDRMLNLPSELLLLKYFEDHGMSGYKVAQPDSTRMESHTPHKNIVFSRFDILYTKQRVSLQARDLLEVGLEVDGKELILLNNHWKSGASNVQTEPIRVQNAMVVKAELTSILFNNPRADVIIAGDFNSYYNHRAAFPELKETGINDILGATGYESGMVGESANGLYNLWFELPVNERGSEVWQGKWGTLMQMIITPGMYDEEGIQYVDNSFRRLSLPGINVEERWGRPIAWSNFGGGSGYSDHLPILARFRVVENEKQNKWMQLNNPTNEALSADRATIDFGEFNKEDIPLLESIKGLSVGEQSHLLGELFKFEGRISEVKPARIQLGNQTLQVYSPIRKIRQKLDKLEAGDEIKAFVEFDEYKGQPQVVIQDESWLN